MRDLVDRLSLCDRLRESYPIMLISVGKTASINIFRGLLNIFIVVILHIHMRGESQTPYKSLLDIGIVLIYAYVDKNILHSTYC